MDTSGTTSSALVIWGSTGRRLQFTRQDLRMPESVKERSNHNFFEKQWDAVAGFWMNRVVKETALQHATVDDIVRCIIKDIERRWEQRKREKALYKRRKRLLDPQGTPAFGVPSPHVLLTNFVSLQMYRHLSLSEGPLDELLRAVLGKVEEVAKEKIINYQVLVDDGGDACGSGGGGGDRDGEVDLEPVGKRLKMEERRAPTNGEEESNGGEAKEELEPPAFDDHVALVCTLSSKSSAANVVAELHGSVFDSRAIMCRFYDL
ncbi:uncharacterized protein TEOVI_000862700 [Trypanosoma equiperdum]|uniref:Uncharacterized protein n=2 Tax=Trypanozoon TaxID=39700 RepID=Q57VJ0_TRYB2|nr:hypothetical protein, conserved [Trypanosoma brucei brucei TREU927]AAX70379.1 hypothetical protein, conserved [Trypanosoma brucei]AAZ12685.1 hypothetical protein, conserved [Trypanosoma brucei brucei TREU927]SCU66173.1 hypothetical protein, conserved [Trypanosoma equiperdum]